MINHPNRSRSTAAKRKVAATSTKESHEHDYSALLASVRKSFDAAIAGQSRLFVTDAADLNELYLNKLPSQRQVHDCSACRHFIQVFGCLVAIGPSGETLPVMWNPEGVPEFYRAAFAAMYERVKRARVTSVFLHNLPVWGTPTTGTWSHMTVDAPPALLYRGRLLTPRQAMASSREDFRTVAAALSDFTAPMLDEALRLLQADALARSDKFIGPVKWLRALHDRPKGRLGENVLWLAVGTAPEGYCHPRASVVGSLLEDIAAGMSFDQIKSRFDAKLAPLQYQRPQVAPSAANIKAAEEIVAKLGIAPSLERRFARLDELPTIWLPATPKETPSGQGIFGHIKPKDSATIPRVDMPATTMTWDKFSRTVLPSAEAVELRVPYVGRFIALTTAANADAPPVLKWDRDEDRNPVAWYVYPNGSQAHQWGLQAGTWTKVTGITQFPTQWGTKPMPFLAEGVILVLDGAKDSYTQSGNALFPECLKEELHQVRATIEAYARGAQLSGREEASACGYDVRKGAADCNVRVLVSGVWNTYHIDRWD